MIELIATVILLFLVFKTIKRDRKNLRPLKQIQTPLLADSTYYDEESNNRKAMEEPSKFPRFRVKIDDFKIKICSSLTTHQEQTVVKMSVVVETKNPIANLTHLYLDLFSADHFLESDYPISNDSSQRVMTFNDE